MLPWVDQVAAVFLLWRVCSADVQAAWAEHADELVAYFGRERLGGARLCNSV